MFCPECGYNIQEDAQFCPECGTRLEEQSGTQHLADKDNVICKNGVYAYGLILTNVSLLATKMNVSKERVVDLLECFIDRKSQYGVVYQLVDVGNYTYKKKNFIGLSRTVHLKSENELWDYMDILMDVHNYELDKGLPESQYLFIIGGDDVIPMPCVQHYSKQVRDKTIDTDILYAYPYGSEMLPLLQNKQIFRYDQLFFVGRLPVSDDTTFEELYDYFERDVQNSYGIPLTEAYGQCDPHWKQVSATVATDLVNNGLFRNLDGRLPKEYYFRKLILSPEVTASNVHQVFHSGASLFYFNLHGGDALEARGYFGEQMQGGMECTLLPEHMATCRVPNVVMCEACYGARFIGLDKSHSMLLASLYTASLLFVGSSRIAWGNVDPNYISEDNQVPPFFADVIGMGFMGGLLSGYTAGQSLFLARSMVLQQDEEGLPNTAATIVEFNLFGDPTLGFAVSNEEKRVCKTVDKSACKITADDYGCVMEKLDITSNSQTSSILQQVRQAVDTNLFQIHNMIGKYLYEEYGIAPRQANSVFRLNYANGKKELSFSYEIMSESQIPVTYIVRTSEIGEIKNVITTK